MGDVKDSKDDISQVVSTGAMDRAFRQFVFESMPLAYTDKDGCIVPVGDDARKGELSAANVKSGHTWQLHRLGATQTTRRTLQTSQIFVNSYKIKYNPLRRRVIKPEY